MPKDVVTWRAVVCYGGGYRIENEHGAVVSQGLNSFYVMDTAIRTAGNRNIQFTYLSEEPEGLVPCDRWGPAGTKVAECIYDGHHTEMCEHCAQRGGCRAIDGPFRRCQACGQIKPNALMMAIQPTCRDCY